MVFRKGFLVYLPKIGIILTVAFICLLMAGLTSCEEEEKGYITVENKSGIPLFIRITDANDKVLFEYKLFPGRTIDYEVNYYGRFKLYKSSDGQSYFFESFLDIDGRGVTGISIKIYDAF
jgi:hypothetical protein